MIQPKTLLLCALTLHTVLQISLMFLSVSSVTSVKQGISQTSLLKIANLTDTSIFTLSPLESPFQTQGGHDLIRSICSLQQQTNESISWVCAHTNHLEGCPWDLDPIPSLFALFTANASLTGLSLVLLIFCSIALTLNLSLLFFSGRHVFFHLGSRVSLLISLISWSFLLGDGLDRVHWSTQLSHYLALAISLAATLFDLIVGERLLRLVNSTPPLDNIFLD